MWFHFLMTSVGSIEKLAVITAFLKVMCVFPCCFNNVSCLPWFSAVLLWCACLAFFEFIWFESMSQCVGFFGAVLENSQVVALQNCFFFNLTSNYIYVRLLNGFSYVSYDFFKKYSLCFFPLWTVFWTLSADLSSSSLILSSIVPNTLSPFFKFLIQIFSKISLWFFFTYSILENSPYFYALVKHINHNDFKVCNW